MPSGDLSYFIEYIERAAAFDSVHQQRPAPGPPAAHQPVPARRPADYGRGLPAGQPAARGHHAGRRTGDGPRGCGDVHVLDAGLADQPEPGDEPDRTSVARGPNGFRANGTPTGVMFSGQLYREGDSWRWRKRGRTAWRIRPPAAIVRGPVGDQRISGTFHFLQG